MSVAGRPVIARRMVRRNGPNSAAIVDSRAAGTGASPTRAQPPFPEPVDLVEEGVDLAIRIGHLPDSSLIALRIGQTGFFICGSPEYLAAAGVPGHPDDLHYHAVVGYVTPDTAVRFAYRFAVDGVTRTMSLPARLTVDDGEALVGAAVRSVGLVIVNDYVAERHLADGSLVRVLREFNAARPGDRPPAAEPKPVAGRPGIHRDASPPLGGRGIDVAFFGR